MKSNLIFTRSESRRLRKNFFNMSYENKFTADMGKLIPFYLEELVAGDRVKVGNEIVIRFQPLVAPILHTIKVKTEYFFVPFRIMDENFESFFTGGKDGFDYKNPQQLPLWDDYLSTDPPKYSLWDYFGLPLVRLSSQELCPIKYPKVAYNMIWNKFYKSEDVDDDVDLDNNDVLYRRWQKDYFTSSLPFPQRGVSPAFPIDGQASAIWSHNLPLTEIGTFGQFDDGSFGGLQYAQKGNSSNNEFLIQSSDMSSYIMGIKKDKSGNEQVNKLFDGLNDNKVDVSNLVTFNISELRFAEQLQNFLEANARGGFRYDEFLLTHFGISPSDARLQEPEYIGGSVSPLMISEVLQTSESSSESPQGNLAGRGIGLSENFITKFTAPEPGYIMGIMSIVPDENYTSQGIEKMFLHRNPFDFYFPEFSHLSERPVINAELYLTDDDEYNKGVFGYQGIYDEYRHRRSIATSDMRDTFDYWSLSRKFATKQYLNSSFLEMKPDKRIFAVQDEPGFICDVYNRVSMLRPIPKFGTPGFMRF